jgi:hypothetical protein
MQKTWDMKKIKILIGTELYIVELKRSWFWTNSHLGEFVFLIICITFIIA